MSDKSKIEWTRGDDGAYGATWNPVTGCSKVSQGCKHCYAEREWPRLAAPRAKPNIYTGRAFTDVKCHPEKLDIPLRWTKPRRIFVNSMSDLFHESVPFEFIASVFSIMGVTTRHTYQVLTKRPARMLEFFKWVHEENPLGSFAADERIFDHWPKNVPWERYDNCGPAYPYENVWLGVSVEDQATADDRIPLLMKTPAAVRWISAEPLLGHTDIQCWLKMNNVINSHSDINRIDWVVVGGESGPKARPMHLDWVRSLRDQCQTAGVPFFFKQWGEWAPHTTEIEGPDGSIKTTPINGVTWRAHNPGSISGLFRVGKKAAGRMLDGRTWDEYPI